MFLGPATGTDLAVTPLEFIVANAGLGASAQRFVLKLNPNTVGSYLSSDMSEPILLGTTISLRAACEGLRSKS